MQLLLRLKHWQLFLFLVCLPSILEIIFILMIIKSDNITAAFSFFPIILIFSMGVFFSWLYTLGTNLHKRLPGTVKMNLTTFKIFLGIPSLYILLISIFMFMAGNAILVIDESQSIGLFALIFPLHLFSMFCIFYCLYFNAKALKAVEWQRPVTFTDFAGEFFLIWFFPVGIWFIQTRINQIFDSRKLANDPT